MKQRSFRGGFTIIELVVVIAVVAILAVVLIPTFGDVLTSAKDSAAIQTAKNAYTQYWVDHVIDGVSGDFHLYIMKDDQVVALRNGEPAGVYGSVPSALMAMVGNGADMALLQNVDGDLWVYRGIDGVGTGSGSQVSGGESESVQAFSYGIFPGKVDTAKFHQMLADDRIQNKTIYLADGVYEFSSTVNLVSNVSICGGANTVLTLAADSSSTCLLKLQNVDNVHISNLTIQGSNTARPSAKGTRSGIWISTCRSINIENVDITGWDLYGLYGVTMSSYGEPNEGKFFKQLQLLNTRFYFNYTGSYFDYRCEYSQVLNCVFGENYIGSVNCGGNNMYTSCMWNSNSYGFILNNEGSNPAHGGCTASSFNHNNNAIQVNNCVNGWSFDSCQIFYGTVKLNNSKGVIFNGNIWGSCSFTSTNTAKNVNLITNTYFLTDSNTILRGNDGSTLITNCLPDYIDTETEPETSVPEGNLLLSTCPDRSAERKALSTNAYSGAATHPVSANTYMDYVEFEVANATATSEVKNINIWIVNQETNTVVQQLVKDLTCSVVYSANLKAYVVRFDVNLEFSFPTYFIVQSERISNVSIAYYSSGKANSGWLRGGTAPTVGEILTPKDSVIPIYAIYQKKDA